MNRGSVPAELVVVQEQEEEENVPRLEEPVRRSRTKEARTRKARPLTHSECPVPAGKHSLPNHGNAAAGRGMVRRSEAADIAARMPRDAQ